MPSTVSSPLIGGQPLRAAPRKCYQGVIVAGAVQWIGTYLPTAQSTGTKATHGRGMCIMSSSPADPSTEGLPGAPPDPESAGEDEQSSVVARTNARMADLPEKY